MARRTGKIPVPVVTEKPCRICEVTKPVELFGKNWRHVDTYESLCLDCQREQRIVKRYGVTREERLSVAPIELTVGVAAYAAGIIDGEGSFFLGPAGKDRHVAMCLQVANTNADIIHWLQRTFGGGMSQAHPASPRCKIPFQWMLTSRGVRKILPALLPYLIIKRRQAEIILAWYAALIPYHANHRKRALTFPLREPLASLYAEFRALNRRGPPSP